MDNQILEFTPSEADIGSRIDKWLSTVSGLSRSRVKALISEGSVLAGEKRASSPSDKVISDSIYRLTVPPPSDPTPKAENIDLDVVFEDEDLIVVNKPAGMTVHPAPGSPSGTLVNALLYHAKDSLSGIGGVARPGIVHRIDKDTSGLLVVAKNDKTHQHLSKQFAAHTVQRVYTCFVRGYPRNREGRLQSRIARSPQNRKKQAVVKGTWGDMTTSEKGRHAVTNFKFIEGYGEMPKAAIGTPLASKVECRLETGRTHQIRVHMAHLGCPLLGDPLYGKQKSFNTTKNTQISKLNTFLSDFNRQALHAQSLGFVHPSSREFLEFSSDLPPDLARLETHLSELS